MEEDSFKHRVNKIFGSLSSSASSSSTTNSSSGLSSLWSLTDDEIEKREWDRHKGILEPHPSNVEDEEKSEEKSLKFIISEIEEEEDEDVADDQVPASSILSAKPEDHDDEEWQIRSSVGLDSTLDYEEEEDEYDKLAVGRGKAGDRVYLNKFIDYGTSSNAYYELPVSVNEAVGDARANHMAATVKLKEDAEAAGSFDSLTVSDKTQNAGMDAQVDTATDARNLKSILKRKENHSVDSKLQKRVRFDPECKNDFQDEYGKADDVEKETCSMEELHTQDQNPVVPDYLRNPSKYTCYTFDSSSEIDEESNGKAYMDFLNLVRKANTMEAHSEDSSSVGLPKSVAFTPRKKTGGDATAVKSSREYNQNEKDAGKEFTQRKGLPIGIAAVVQENEVCAMDEDEPETLAENSNSSRKSGRQYRSKDRSELDHIP